MGEYMLQTDRIHQWRLIEKDLRRDNLTRKDINWHKEIFFGEHEANPDVPWRLRFNYHSKPTMGNWAAFFLQKGIDLTDREYGWLQSQFAGYLWWTRFSVHDLRYYFESVFGEVWKNHIEFPFPINGEKKLRKVTVSPSAIMAHLGRGATAWISGVKGSYDYNVMRFELDYFSSILPLIDHRAFSDQEFRVRDKTEDGQASIRALQSILRKLLLYSHLPSSEYLSQEQVDFAVQARDIILEYDGKPKEFEQMYDVIKAKVDRVEFELLEGEGRGSYQIVYR